ncbi:phosphotriesterase-related protein [Nocardioides agariphilus]|uniref:Phosphotriesterase-related protein n=1 Tax=Nocardioides agariphilus TaxID=433664 RepID=A0A930YP17_9ACTN|nr:phosphotriesterase-related protein [Nocardioides agariphilus]MBF4769769.1 phosphotriesterase-related protein [Nocardioides agariphilus]
MTDTHERTVSTTTGEVPVTGLGPTLMHEHLFVFDAELERNWVRRWDRAEQVDLAVRKLDRAYDHGIRTVVDLTVIGLGRDVELVREVGERTRVQLVVATGVYTFNELPRYVTQRGPGSMNGGPDVLGALLKRDIEEGIAGTDVRASVLKVATDEPGVTPGVERMLRTTAQVHRETGVPIMTHANASLRQGLAQLDIFESEGVDLSRVVIGHCGDSRDLDYHRELLDRGAYVGLDRFGLVHLLPDEDRAEVVAELCRQGYADRLVLSHDSSTYSHSFEPATRERLGDWDYSHISRVVLPALAVAGVAQEQIDQMLVRNPMAVLGHDGPY